MGGALPVALLTNDFATFSYTSVSNILYYSSTDCTGQAYIGQVDFPAYGSIARGSTLYYQIAPLSTVPTCSSQQGSGNCFLSGCTHITGAPTATFDLTVFTPPFHLAVP
jgi:hypothetical protein